MEETWQPLGPHATQFFHRLRQTLHLPLFFFGSVQRVDYFPGHSDVDVDIFTPNTESTVRQICALLGQSTQTDTRRFVYKLHRTNQLVRGIKIKHKDAANHFKTELSIYNDDVKDAVLEEHRFKTWLPWYVTCLLCVVKWMYYRLGWMPKRWYLRCKQFLMNRLVDGEDGEFLVTDLD